MKKQSNETKEKVCVNCGRRYFGIGALSRRDNKTEICSQCGVEEAMFDYFNFEQQKKMKYYEEDIETLVLKIIDLKRKYGNNLNNEQKDNLQSAIAYMLKAKESEV